MLQRRFLWIELRDISIINKDVRYYRYSDIIITEVIIDIRNLYHDVIIILLIINFNNYYCLTHAFMHEQFSFYKDD